MHKFKPSPAVSRQGILGILFGLAMGALATAGMTSAQTADDALRLSQRHATFGNSQLIGMGVRGFGGIGVQGALHSNPAGLGYVGSSSLSISLDALHVKDVASSGSPGFISDTWEISETHTGLGNLSYVHDVPTTRGSLVFGLSLAEVHSFNRDMEFSGLNELSTISTSFLPYGDEYTLTEDGGLDQLNDLPFAAFNGGMIEYFPSLMDNGEYPFLEAVIPGSAIEQTGNVRDSGQLFEGGMGLAFEAARNLMVGISANLVFGGYDFESRFNEIDVNNENGFDDYNVLEDDGNLLEGFDRLRYSQRFESDLVGFNAKFGVSKQLTQSIRVGLAIETPTWMYIEESYGASYTTEFDDGGVLSYGDRADDVGNGFFEYDLSTPWRIGAGVHAKFGAFQLIGDLELVDWAQMKYSSATEKGLFRDVNRTIDELYGITVNTNLGAEMDLGIFTLRGGLALRPDPLKETPRASGGEQLSRERSYFGFGTALDLSSRLRLDVAWQREMSDDTWFAYPEDEYGPRQDTFLQFDEVLTRDWVIVELTYRL